MGTNLTLKNASIKPADQIKNELIMTIFLKDNYYSEINYELIMCRNKETRKFINKIFDKQILNQALIQYKLGLEVKGKLEFNPFNLILGKFIQISKLENIPKKFRPKLLYSDLPFVSENAKEDYFSLIKYYSALKTTYLEIKINPKLFNFLDKCCEDKKDLDLVKNYLLILNSKDEGVDIETYDSIRAKKLVENSRWTDSNIAPINIKIQNYKYPIEFGKFTLRKSTNREKNSLFGKTDKDDAPMKFILGDFEFNIMQKSNYIITCKDENYLKNNLEILLICFKLIKKGDPYCPIAYIRSFEPHLILTSNYKFESFEYILDETKIEEINSLFKILVESKNKKIIYIVEKLKYVLFTSVPKNNLLVDYVSIIESLLIEGQHELSFRFSLISSYILKNIFKYEEVSFEKMKDYYNIRSGLVHSLKLKKGISEQNFQELESYTMALVKFALFEKERVKNIENEILSKLKLNKL